VAVRFEGVEYTLSFVDARFVTQKGFTVGRASEGFIYRISFSGFRCMSAKTRSIRFRRWTPLCT
jgi:hypothetical protein